MQENAFSEALSQIGNAEKQKQRMIDKANSDAAIILKDARIKAQEIEEKALEEGTVLSDKLFLEQTETVKKEEEQIIKKAQAQMQRFSEKSLSNDASQRIIKLIVG